MGPFIGQPGRLFVFNLQLDNTRGEVTGPAEVDGYGLDLSQKQTGRPES